MMSIQDAAYQLLSDRDYDDVYVTAIAEQAGVGPATVYRYFGSKDRIMSWNEHDPQIVAAIRERTSQLPAFTALRTALTTDIAPLLDNRRQRGQLALIYRSPSLAASIATYDIAASAALAKLLLDSDSELSELAADVFARTSLAALDAAFHAWHLDQSARPLSSFIDGAFESLGQFGCD